MQRRDCLPLVATGLHIKVKGNEEKVYDFTYKWAPFTSSAYPIEWMPLVNIEVTYPHIRCHQLKEGDDLPFLMANMDSAPSTEALLLINTEDSYEINPKFLPLEEKSMYPVFTVTAETGQVLLEALDKFEVEIKVELSDQTTTGQASELLAQTTGWFVVDGT